MKMKRWKPYSYYKKWAKLRVMSEDFWGKKVSRPLVLSRAGEKYRNVAIPFGSFDLQCLSAIGLIALNLKGQFKVKMY